MASNQAVTLFISYAHRDEELKSQLDKHLTPLKLQRVIDKWSDRQIEGGQDWAHQIDSNLRSADIILLLVSPDFVSSDYCAGVELKAAMQRYRDGEAIVVPVILEPCDWKWLDFGKLQATPKDGKAITDWANVNSAFLDVTNTIRQIAQGLLDKRQKKLEERQAASARYKAKVEEVLSDGDITPLERKTLNELRDKLGLTPDEAEAIKDSAYQPLREYQGKLAQYRVDLVETIQHEYPLSERTKVDLKQRQRELGLKAEDADRLDAEVLAGAEASYQAKLKSSEAAELQWARAEADRLIREVIDTAEAARRSDEAEARRQAEEADRRRLEDERQQIAARQAREAAQATPQPEPVSLHLQQAPAARAAAMPSVSQPPMSAPAAPAAADPVVQETPARSSITLRMRLLAAGIGGVASGASQVIGPLLASRSVNSEAVMIVAVIGAIAGAIIAGYRWIAAVAAASVLGMVVSGSRDVLDGVVLLGLAGGAVVIPLRRWLKARK